MQEVGDQNQIETAAERRREGVAGKGLVNGEPAVYICERFTCRRPATTAAELAPA